MVKAMFGDMVNVSLTDGLTRQCWRNAPVGGIALAMPSPPQRRASRSAGVLFGILPVAGLLIGAVLRQPSIGLVAGLSAAGALTLLFWLADRR